ncbi:MAG: hypothetical protein M0R21_01180 [Lentimicrobiaceae bacterium]|nr:hypothetical protein [Lentimicrobiaceae bacterium]
MKNNYFLRMLFPVLFLVMFGASPVLKAQEEFADFINQSKEDVNTIVKAYGGPMLKAIGNNYNNGWYSTADPLNLGRFDIRFVGTASFCPKSDQSFNFNDLNLRYLQTAPGSPEKVPTVFGKKNQQAKIQVLASVPGYADSLKVTRTQVIPTAGINFMPGIVPQINVGLIKNTELMLRFLPEIKVPVTGDQSLYTSSWGLGIKHDIKQWIPYFKKLPISMSVYAAYANTGLYAKGPFLTPEDLPGGYNNPEPKDYDAQKINFNTTSWNAGIIVSKKVSVLTVFGGINFSSSSSSLDMSGYYPYVKPLENDEYEIAHIEKPVDIKTNTSQLGINAGFRLKLAIVSLTIQGTYAPGGYSSATAALGFGWFN